MNPAFASALSHALFHFLWEGSTVAILLAAALYGVRPRSASVRYAFACVAMLAMLGSFTATVACFWPHPHPVAIRAVTAPPPDSSVFLPPVHAPAPKPPSPNWIAPLWLLGVLLFSLRSVASWLAAARLKRTAIAAAAIWREKLVTLAARARLSRPLKLLESCAVEIPVVIGFLKPAILVPASLFTGFPAEHLEVILLHELAHIRRQDYLVNLLQRAVEDILFYHPAVWWVSSVIRAEREHCCDDAVLAAQGDAHEFAEALASLEQKRWSAYEAALGTGVAATGGHLLYRIQRLLNPRDSRPRFTAAPVFSAGLAVAAAVIAVSSMHAQNPPAPRPAPAPQPVPQPKPQAAPVPENAAPQPAAEREAALKRELETPYKKWLDQEVSWIITPAERKEFQGLATDEDRERFIERFWLQRDPTPSTIENEYREEYYRRILYADDNFSSGIPGWKTDRGMIYIKYGPPDQRFFAQFGLTGSEQWHYRYIEGLGNDVFIEFVDPTGKGEYQMTADPAEKDKLLHVPGAGLGTGTMPLPASMNQFQRVQAFAALQAPPKPTVAPEDAIEDIRFVGARRVPQDLLLNLVPTRTGDRLDQNTLDRDAKLLWDTGRFDDVTVRYARGKVGWIVTFNVVERPVPAPQVDDRLLLK